MELNKMTSINLKKWILSLEYNLKITDEKDPNFKLFNKWLKEAKNEQTARFERREEYLRRAGYDKNKTRRFY